MENKKIGERIRRIRSSKGMTQENVAHDLGITAGAYAKIERGETDAPLSRILQIAKALEIHIIELFEDRTKLPSWKEHENPYGFASKSDVESLAKAVEALAKELKEMRNELPERKSVRQGAYSKKKSK
ncbi:MAG: helix-turn-helix domain-containing protein [Bacteroidia bacterium]